ncbi:IS1595 family transposase [Candidatus Poribacteria bacterium]|nr:IS1595 family transposase [Candidatus Poribacteria bacterium]
MFLLSGTIFQGTKIPLQKWFLAISLMVNAKKSLSSCQLARDLGLNQKVSWRVMMKIRSEIAKLIPDISGETIANFIRANVDTENATLYTDQFKGYNTIYKEMEHETLNRSEKWEKGGTHTNTIEGFWTFIKRAWYGSHHHYSTGYTPLYLAETCYKYNNRSVNIFDKFLQEAVKA